MKIKCGHCDGTGRRELSKLFLTTLQFLHFQGSATGAELCRRAKCKPTTMNNRLAKLEEFGLVTSERIGKRRVYRAK